MIAIQDLQCFIFFGQKSRVIFQGFIKNWNSSRGVARIFQSGGHTVSKWEYSPHHHGVFARIFQRGVTLCQSEGTRHVFMAFLPPVVGCLLKKGLQKGGRGHPRTPLATPLSSLPTKQAALKFYLPWASVSLLFYNLVGRRLAWALTHWASENEKLLAPQENLLVLDDQTALFSSPAIMQCFICKCW